MSVKYFDNFLILPFFCCSDRIKILNFAETVTMVLLRSTLAGDHMKATFSLTPTAMVSQDSTSPVASPMKRSCVVRVEPGASSTSETVLELTSMFLLSGSVP